MHFENPINIIWRDIYDEKLKEHFLTTGIQYKKNMPGLYWILKSKQNKAIENAERLEREHSKIDINPSTTIHILIKILKDNFS